MNIVKYILFLAISLLLSSCATLPSSYLSLRDNTTLEMDHVIGRIEGKQALFVGEGHMNPADHLVQLEVIRRLHESGKKVAVAMEMFTEKKIHLLNKWRKGGLSEAEFKTEYYKEWSVPFDYYEGIFRYVRDNHIPLFGINADKSFINQIAKYGTGSIENDLRQKLKLTACAEEPQYEKAMKRYEGLTKTSHTAELPFFCDAQRVRDATMAYNLANILGMDDYAVVVLIGSAHASKIALPAMLLNHINIGYAVLMPRSFRTLTGGEIDAEMADYIWY
jgi:uncharacterized iron-regulated protein